MGDPRSKDSMMGALISQEHMAKVESYLKYAVEDGGTVECGYGVDILQLPDRNKTVSTFECS